MENLSLKNILFEEKNEIWTSKFHEFLASCYFIFMSVKPDVDLYERVDPWISEALKSLFQLPGESVQGSKTSLWKVVEHIIIHIYI